jgi:hypothetical protein
MIADELFIHRPLNSRPYKAIEKERQCEKTGKQNYTERSDPICDMTTVVCKSNHALS